jgi:hypothetical protein
MLNRQCQMVFRFKGSPESEGNRSFFSFAFAKYPGSTNLYQYVFPQDSASATHQNARESDDI